MAIIDYITRIVFDEGAIREVGNELARVGISRPMIVTDKGVLAAGLCDRLEEALGFPPAARYADTPSNPREADVRACLSLMRESGADGLIALGGGSPIDLAKATGLLATHGGRFQDYEIRAGGSARIGPITPWLAIPTTAGTGAEVGRASVIIVDDGRRLVAVSLKMKPSAVICDPELTYGLPARITAATGVDALTHGLEAFCSTVDNPPAAAIALDCVTHIGAALRRAVGDGLDAEARRMMMMGALEGGLALQKSLGAIHALSSPLGEAGLHHGMANAIVMPAVLAWNAPAIPQKIATLKRALALAEKDDLAVWAAELVADIGLPTRLSELDIEKGQLAEMAALAKLDHLDATNPRETRVEDYEKLLEEVF